MRVKISYSLDMAEVPSKVSELFSELESEINSISETHKITKSLFNCDLEDEGVMPLILSNIDKIRQEMAVIDSCLLEHHNILNGYWKAISEPESEASPSEAEQFMENPNANEG